MGPTAGGVAAEAGWPWTGSAAGLAAPAVAGKKVSGARLRRSAAKGTATSRNLSTVLPSTLEGRFPGRRPDQENDGGDLQCRDEPELDGDVVVVIGRVEHAVDGDRDEGRRRAPEQRAREPARSRVGRP